MKNPGRVKITAQGDREIVISRSFDAPRELVFEAFTKPEYIQRWLLGPDGWTMPVCQVDLRVGGKYRYVWRNGQDGREMGMGGVFREIAAPERFVATEQFDEAWYPGEAVCTFSFSEQGGSTTITQTVTYDSEATRDAVLKSPMESGVSRSYERLEEILSQLQKRERSA